MAFAITPITSLIARTPILTATTNGLKMSAPSTTTQAYVESKQVEESKALITELCRQFYHLGWVGGTGGSITLKVHDALVPKSEQLIIMSPSGVQKERMMAEDMYVLSPDGNVLSSPTRKPYPHKPPKCSDCGPLFMKAYQMRDAGAVIHSHGMESCLVTMMNPTSKEFRITHMEMIKGIQGHGYYDELVVPIIENSAHERDLTDALAEAMEAYPKATAVLVRNHGIYVWGDSWISAKTQAECYHYLFDAAIKLNQMGLDWSTPAHGPLRSVAGVSRSENRVVSAKAGTFDSNPTEPLRCIVLDIEGTTTPISFVTDVLFPYARTNVGRHLSSTYETPETQDDIKLLRSQVQEDLEAGVAGAVPVPSEDEGKEKVVAALVDNVEAMIKADRKITALKQLQGHIWRTGFQNNELQGVVFEDVPEALERWHSSGIKVYIYSSGSRLAQRLLFGYTKFGDLRKYLSGFFDTNVGNKRETRSYIEIGQSLGVDNPSQILFITDVYQGGTWGRKHTKHVGQPTSAPNQVDREKAEEEEPEKLSHSIIDKAAAALEVLREVLDAVNAQNPEAAKDEFTLDLVEQCSFQKDRVMHLVMKSRDEKLVLRAIELNEQLGRVLERHEALVSHRPVSSAGPIIHPERVIPTLNHNNHEDSGSWSSKNTNHVGQSTSTPNHIDFEEIEEEEEAEQLSHRIRKGKAHVRPEDEESAIERPLGLLGSSSPSERLHRPLIRPVTLDSAADETKAPPLAVSIPPPPAKHVEREKFFKEKKGGGTPLAGHMRGLSLHSRNGSNSSFTGSLGSSE